MPPAFKRRRKKKVFCQRTGAFTAPEISLLGLTKYFDGILLSSDAGVKKPDPAFCEMLLEAVSPRSGMPDDRK